MSTQPTGNVPLPSVRYGGDMTKSEDTNWKTKMGVEFSGLQGTREFLFAFGCVALLIAIGMLIAYLSFG